MGRRRVGALRRAPNRIRAEGADARASRGTPVAPFINRPPCQELPGFAIINRMNVSLTPALERLVNSKVASGRYTSASEVVREALRLLEQIENERRARLAQLRRELDRGIAALDQGPRFPFSDDVVQRIKSRGRKRLSALHKKRS